MVTFAPGNTAPLLSVMMPSMLPVAIVLCASSHVAALKTHATITANEIIFQKNQCLSDLMLAHPQ
jgi:hypothetical protein